MMVIIHFRTSHNHLKMIRSLKLFCEEKTVVCISRDESKARQKLFFYGSCKMSLNDALSSLLDIEREVPMPNPKSCNNHRISTDYMSLIMVTIIQKPTLQLNNKKVSVKNNDCEEACFHYRVFSGCF